MKSLLLTLLLTSGLLLSESSSATTAPIAAPDTLRTTFASESPHSAAQQPAAQQPATQQPSAPQPSVKDPTFTVKLHGTVRAKFEYQPDLGQSRFQVRNARFSLSGSVTRAVD